MQPCSLRKEVRPLTVSSLKPSNAICSRKDTHSKAAAVSYALSKKHGPVNGYHSRVSTVAVLRSVRRIDTTPAPRFPAHSGRHRPTGLVIAEQYHQANESRLPYV